MSKKLEQSKQDGAHALLASMVGEWEGVANTWFEPGKLGDESPIKGTTRLVLDGMFLLHEYEGTLGGNPMKGMAIIAYSLGEQQWQVAWVDSIHNGTRIMFSKGTVPGEGLSPSSKSEQTGESSERGGAPGPRKQGQCRERSALPRHAFASRTPKSGTVPDVLGSYPPGDGSPDWGWRTKLELRDKDNLVITHYNITPDGEEAPGVEINYKRTQPPA